MLSPDELKTIIVPSALIVGTHPDNRVLCSSVIVQMSWREFTWANMLQTYVASWRKSRTERSWAHPAQDSVFFCHLLNALHSNIIIKNTVNTQTVMKHFLPLIQGEINGRVSAVVVLDCYSPGCMVGSYYMPVTPPAHEEWAMLPIWWMLMGNGDFFQPCYNLIGQHHKWCLWLTNLYLHLYNENGKC